MPYTFKLEALRKYHEFEEERAQKALSEAERIREAAAEKLTAHIEHRHTSEKTFARQQATLAPPQAAMYRHFMQRLTKEINILEQKLKLAAKACDKKRQALLKAVQRRKTLDRLKEKGEQAYMEALSRDEEKFIDEMAINRHMLKRR